MLFVQHASIALTMSTYIYNTNKAVSIKIELNVVLWGKRFKKTEQLKTQFGCQSLH